MKKPHWTKEEIFLLEKFYPSSGAKYCSRMLEKSEQAIRQKAHVLQIKCLISPRRDNKSYSKLAIEWLKTFDNSNILHAENGGERFIAGYLVDGYDPITNTAYEFHGDCWHGNPEKYNWDDKCHPYNDKTASQLYFETVQKSMKILKVSNLIEVWESEFKRGLNGNCFKKGSYKIHPR